MAVVLIVDQADVGGSLLSKAFEDLELILRFAEPIAVVVERDGATDPRGGLGDGPQPGRLGIDTGALFLRAFRGTAGSGDPELRSEVVTLEEIEDVPGFVVPRGGKPP